jgi:hypothetical protein
MGRNKKKGKAPKLPKYELVSRQAEAGKAIYAIVDDMVKKVHTPLRNARIVLAWMVGKKADRDGHLILGRMRKASELDRQLTGFDLVLLLNREKWDVLEPAQRLALVDHELCHADQNIDKNGEPVTDGHGHETFRTRKHDIEEFSGVVRRHGIWIDDLKAFAAAIDEGERQRKLFDEKPNKKLTTIASIRRGTNAARVAAT